MAAQLLIPAIASALQAGYGIYRGIKADKALKELQKQRMARYMDAAGPLQQNLAMAQRQYQMGLSPQARALATGTAASQMAGQYRAATDLAGGQMGSALGRIGAFNMNQLGLNLGMQDQMARERAMQQMMGINTQLSGLQQRDVAQDINYRIMLEQNYGLAKQQGIRDVMGAVTGFGTAALSSYNAAQDREMYKQLYGTGGNKVAGLSDLPYGSSTESGAFGLRVPQGMGVPKTPTVFGLRTTRNT